MGAAIATVGRRKYAVGLYWQPSPEGRLAQAAKEAARQSVQQADYYALRPGIKGGRVAQFCLGQSQAGHKFGMPSLAATLANHHPGSWAGAFRVNEGIVVIVVRDDLIAPDGDQIYLDEAEARDRLIQEFTLGGLQRLYAPEAWTISGAETTALPFLVQDKAEAMLRPVTIPRSMILGGVGALLAALLVFAGLWYYQAKQEEEERILQEQLRAQAALAGAQQVAAIKIIYPPPVRYWEQEPSPLAVIQACRSGLDSLSATMLGWDLSSLSCSRTALSVAWNRESGYAKMVKEASIEVSTCGE